MCIVYYNILDSMTFNSMGHCTWCTWMDLCDLLCDSIYVKIKIMQCINGCKYGKSKILKGKKKYFYVSRYTRDYKNMTLNFE